MPHPKDDPNPGISAAWKSKQHIILEKTQMSRHLINHLYFAWTTGSSVGLEHPLYGLYSFVLLLLAVVTEYNYPHASLNVGAQAAFQQKRGSSTQPASGSESKAPSESKSGFSPANTNSAVHDSTSAVEAAPRSQLDMRSPLVSSGPSLIDGGLHNVPVETADSSQPSASKSKQETAPEPGRKRIPDFARMFIASKPPKHLISEAPSIPGEIAAPAVVIADDIIIDVIEIKPLEVLEGLQLDDVGQETAEMVLYGHLEQVYETAQTTLEHNHSWDNVSVILIIGFFFTQFVWTRAKESPKEQVSVPYPPNRPRRPVTPQPVPSSKPVPDLSPFAPFIGDTELLASQISKDNLNELLHDGKAQRAILRERSLPVIYHYNEPAFILSEELGHKKTCTLTDKFIAALTRPLRDPKIVQEQLVVQPSWLDCDEAAIPPTHDQKITDHICARLCERLIQASYDQDEALAGSDEVAEKVKKSPQQDSDEADYVPPRPKVQAATAVGVRRSAREHTRVPTRRPEYATVQNARTEAAKLRRAAERAAEEGVELEETAGGQPPHTARPLRGGVQRARGRGKGAS